MKYEESGNKRVSRSAAINETIRSIDTKALLWALIKRHKFFLVCTYAVILTLLYVFPMIGTELISL